MRLPFLQMESDLISHGGPEVAHLAGCSIPAALGHLALLRAWAVALADDSAPPDGWVAGESAGRRIEAAAQWPGPPGRLLSALADSGQISNENGGVRVCHLEPYAKAWEQNRKSKERMRNARERSANFDGQTQTQTQTQKILPSEGEPSASAPVPKHDFSLQPTPRGKKPRKASESEVVYARMQSERAERCAEVGKEFVAEHWPEKRQNAALGPIQRLSEGLQSRFFTAWRLYLADNENVQREPAWSLSWFIAAGVRARYESRAAEILAESPEAA